MKTFIEQNWFKIGLLLILLIVASSGAYYFIVFSAQQGQENLIQNQTSCAQMETKIIAEKSQAILPGLESITSRNHYNLELHKCFVEYIYTFHGTAGDMNVISLYDAIENKEIATCSGADSSYVCSDERKISYSNVGDNISKEQFDSLEKQYMTQ